MSGKRPALGRGLGALIPERVRDESGPSAAPAARDGTPRSVAIDRIQPNPEQPRKHFDSTALDELAASIRAVGVIQPLVVSPVADAPGRYRIVAGERRWRAAQRAGLQTVPTFVRETSDLALLEIALIENLQREDLDPIEEARAYEELIETHAYTQEVLSARVGKDRSTIANMMRLLRLPPKIRELVSSRALSMGHARALLGLEETAAMLRLADAIVRKQLSVRATELEVRRLGRAHEAGEPAQDDDHRRHRTIVADLENRLQRHLGARVRLHTGRKGNKGPGKIEIPYADLDDLNRILHQLLGTAER